jgi:outer membrane protein
MGIRQLRSGKNLIVLLFLASLCSCAKYEAHSSADYIGPKASEPNARTADVNEGTNPQSAIPNPQSVEGPVEMTVEQATLLTLENNRSLVVQRFEPQVTRTFVQEGLAAFDPVLAGVLAYQENRFVEGPPESEFSGPSAALGVEQFLPTGTTLGLTGRTGPNTSGAGPAEENDYATRIGLDATQSLLRGFGPAVNLASVNQAKIDVQISQYELRGFAQTLVAQVEDTYWDYVAAERRIEIFTQSLDLAQKQLEETQERIRVGDIAATELWAAEAEVALRRENLINARSTLAKTKLDLLRLVNPPGANLWDREVVLTSPPVSPPIALDDVEAHVALALQMRPDLNQARLLYQRDELEVVKTRNGLLPRLDLFVTLGRTGFADSFGRSVQNLGDNNYDALVGLDFEYPPWNRSAQARQLRAVLTRKQARAAIGNLAQLVEVDVRSAYVEVARAQEQVTATAATRRLQEEKFRAETEKFRLGKSTSLLVGQTQRDLLVSQIDELQAVISYLKSFVDLYRLEGSLLERRGIAGPGREPVKGPDVP